jgi:hypothetical protein
MFHEKNDVKETYMENHGTVNDATYWWKLSQTLRDEIVDIFWISHIAASNNDVGTTIVERIDLVLGLAFDCSATRKQNNVLCAFADHPCCHAASKTASTADQDVCSVFTEEVIMCFDAWCLLWN